MTGQILQAVDAIKLAYLSHTPIVWLVSSDKEVASEVVESFTIEHFGSFRRPVIGRPVYLQEFTATSHTTTTTPSVFFKWLSITGIKSDENKLQDVLNWLECFVSSHLNIPVEVDVQTLDDSQLKALRQSLVIVASNSIPKETWLSRYMEVVHVRSMVDVEIKELITTTLAQKNVVFQDVDKLDQLVVNLRGFSPRLVSQTINRCILLGSFDSTPVKWKQILNEVRLLKRQTLNGFIGLKWIDIQLDSPDDLKEVDVSHGQGASADEKRQSLDIISEWLDDRRAIFEDAKSAVKAGYDIPKGVLITGVPGTGKSMMAKKAAKKLNLPLIALDMGDLQEGLVGASEQHMVDALRMVDNLSPCVLWIDEIEKAFSGSNSGNSDGGVMRRMFGKFLTWMQEKTEPSFVFATSNDISKLPPELFRSERFDDKFYSFLPMVDECSVIFSNLIADENRRFAENNPDSMHASLFSEELTDPSIWKEFLNNYSGKGEDLEVNDSGWKDGIVPQRKLFTGADISMVVKLVKFKLLKSTNFINYKKELVFKTVVEVLAEFMPYGQTNLRDVVKCFVLLSKNRFRSASSSSVISFDDYNAENAIMLFDKERYADAYDKVLYAVVVGAVNFYAKEIRDREATER